MLLSLVICSKQFLATFSFSRPGWTKHGVLGTAHHGGGGGGGAHLFKDDS